MVIFYIINIEIFILLIIMIMIIIIMIIKGNAEWIDNNHKSIRIFIKKIDVIANDIYDWIKKIGGIGTVYTIYELTSGIIIII